ncbi:hypothetical protein Tco_1237718 [Tanacetum coccineum]
MRANFCGIRGSSQSESMHPDIGLVKRHCGVHDLSECFEHQGVLDLPKMLSLPLLKLVHLLELLGINKHFMLYHVVGAISSVGLLVVENNRCVDERVELITHIVWIKTVVEGVDEFDRLAELTDEMQLKQEDQGCVHASNELQLHVVHVVVDEHES